MLRAANWIRTCRRLFTRLLPILTFISSIIGCSHIEGGTVCAPSLAHLVDTGEVATAGIEQWNLEATADRLLMTRLHAMPFQQALEGFCAPADGDDPPHSHAPIREFMGLHSDFAGPNGVVSKMHGIIDVLFSCKGDYKGYCCTGVLDLWCSYRTRAFWWHMRAPCSSHPRQRGVDLGRHSRSCGTPPAFSASALLNVPAMRRRGPRRRDSHAAADSSATRRPRAGPALSHAAAAPSATQRPLPEP